jgi:predicted acetyltransferase
VHKYKDFNKEFTLLPVLRVNENLESQFLEEINKIDEDLINYYKQLNLENPSFYELICEELSIGYAKTFTQIKYCILSEIYIVNNFRELGLGTFILNSIRTEVKKQNLPLRTITLPSDRVAKNFYEASGITARILLMEEKRDKPRYRS